MNYATPLLDQCLALRHRENKQQRLVAMQQVILWLNTNGKDYAINRAYIFGSITRSGRFTKRSDVDIAVESIDPDRFFMAMAKLSEVLERSVDLVELSKCAFADRIRQEGIPWIQES